MLLPFPLSWFEPYSCLLLHFSCFPIFLTVNPSCAVFMTSWKPSEWPGSINLPAGLVACMSLLTGCKVSAQRLLRPPAKDPAVREPEGHSTGTWEIGSYQKKTKNEASPYVTCFLPQFLFAIYLLTSTFNVYLGKSALLIKVMRTL